MNILVIGGGGREHALVWKLSQSKRAKRIYCAGGNGGTMQIAENLAIDILDNDALVRFAKQNAIDLTIVGPETPLLNGIVDAFEVEGLRIFGPSKRAALLEGSKVYAKRIMQKYHIPTGRAEILSDPQQALSFLEKNPWARVIKADGLSSGKGVYVCNSHDEAARAVCELMVEKKFGDAGNRILAEERLFGEEVSFLAFTDGNTVRPLLTSQDHKRAYDHDEGPNTGGMGAYAPAPIMTAELQEKVMATVMRPMVAAMAAEGAPYKGVLYAGLMLTSSGMRVLEFNCRFGDPEAQPLLSLLETDLVAIAEACIDGSLAEQKVVFRKGAACCVVLAAGGYPEKFEKGKRIHGLTEAGALENLVVFHAGTRKERDGMYSNGGRVLGVTGTGSGVAQAIARAYEGVAMIYFDQMHYRRDIGQKALMALAISRPTPADARIGEEPDEQMEENPR